MSEITIWIFFHIPVISYLISKSKMPHFSFSYSSSDCSHDSFGAIFSELHLVENRSCHWEKSHLPFGQYFRNLMLKLNFIVITLTSSKKNLLNETRARILDL